MVYRVIYEEFSMYDLKFHETVLLETEDKELANKTAEEQSKAKGADQLERLVYTKEYYYSPLL
ncbi:MAG: hypothetical protein NC120_06235 [Ruminococcus sp.]|nr:hypothetical protein [Ruminococcus sp.]